jgi:DNA-binding response OmpR family regulator
MPEMGGFECTAIIRTREQGTGQHLPIVAMTAHRMEGDDTRCLAAGMDAYMSKPIDADNFFDVVERQLRVARTAGSSPPADPTALVEADPVSGAGLNRLAEPNKMESSSGPEEINDPACVALR